MGLHISRLSIQNFRNFASFVVDPFPNPAVIVGENGVGKSNLLYALRLVLDPSLPDSARVLSDSDFHQGPSGVSMAAGGTIVIQIDLSGYDEDLNALSLLKDSSIPGENHCARITYRYRPRSNSPAEPKDSSDGFTREVPPSPQSLRPADYEYTILGGLEEGIDVRRLRQDIGIRILPALRDAENDLRSWRRNPLRDILERRPPGDDKLTTAAEALKDVMSSLSEDPNIAGIEAALTSKIDSMVGKRNDLHPTLAFASAEKDHLLRSIRLFVDSTRDRTVSEVSLGNANTLYLALLLQALEEQRTANAFVATLLAVEEPESHLHVTLQRHLFNYLLRAEPSLILTTHSPHIAAVSPLSSYVLLHASRSGTVGTTTGRLALAEHQSADLERYMDQTRAEMLFANFVILVEGLAELYIIPALADACGFNLDEYGVVVSSVQGTDFTPYAKLLGASGLNIPFVIITDGDIDAKREWAREGGIRRAAGLVPGERSEEFSAAAHALQVNPDDDMLRAKTRADLAVFGIFVGMRTLETDLCQLLGHEIIEAYKELATTGIEDVTNGVANEGSSGNRDAELRAAFLDRISSIGKGRFAQRLAAHISARSMPEIAEIIGIAPFDFHVLAALHQVSQRTRQSALIEGWA